MHGWGYSMRILMTWMVLAGLAMSSYAAEQMIDPTQPPAAVMPYLPEAQAESALAWQVTAIQDNGKSGFAVVNEQLVQLGEVYQGFKLISVKHQQAVFINKNGEKKTLGLGLTNFVVQAQPPAHVKKTKQAKTIKK